MKSTSRKTWQTSLIFLELPQIQNLKRKSGGDMEYYIPPPEKVEGTRPPCPPPNCAHDYNKLVTTYSQSDRQLDDIFERGNAVPHENEYIRKINLQKTPEITEIKRRELLNYTKKLTVRKSYSSIS